MEKVSDQLISDKELIPVILSGGSGSRLWPLSRSSYPKQYLNLDKKNNFSLLQNTYLRLEGLENLSNPIIISNQEQRFIVSEQMKGINVQPKSIILEPFGKNTAPAITLAALKSLEGNNDPFLLILSSDHKINDEESFKKVIRYGLNHANKGRIVTFGVVPDNPATGYGYIESFEELSKEKNSSKIKKFIEKPNSETAKKLITNNNYFWNSGIFLFKSSVVLKELERFEPKILNACKEAINKGSIDLDFFRINEKAFLECPKIPFDIAVMEKTSLGTVLRFQSDWDDIGSWKSVWENSAKDKLGNAVKGRVIIENSQNCYLRSESRLIAGIDLKDLIIVETNDAILVSNKESSQKVKELVEDLNKNNISEASLNKKSFRPWGCFTNIEKGNSWQVKKLEIKPNSSISLQMHHHRSEHWIVVNGQAKVEINQKISILNKNESIYIPKGSKHRLSNPRKTPLILIEVQSGEYLGEDDIVRFEDNYGRANK